MLQFRPLHFTAHLFAASFAMGGEPVVPAFAPAVAENPAKPPGWLAVTPGYLHQFETDLKDTDASYSADRWRVDAGTRIPFTDSLTVSVLAEAEWSSYEFSGIDVEAIGLSDDADSLFLSHVVGLAVYDMNDTWQLVAGGSVSWGGDFDVSLSDGLGASGLLGVTYRFTPKFSLTPGVMALSRLEDDALIIPVVGMDWQISDAWRLRSIGPGAELTWDANEEWGFFLRGVYRPRDYRLASDAAVSSGVLRERTFPVSIGVEWRPTSRVTASVFGGAIFGGNVQVLEEDGHEVFDEDAEVAPIVGGSLRVMF